MEVNEKMPFELGVSSACYYPLETEKSLELAGEYGFKTVELFINAACELDDDYINKFVAIKEKYDINIISVHPFSSGIESLMLFSDYERRFIDTLPLYENFFRASKKLGAKYFVIHGSRNMKNITLEEYCRRYKVLIDMGASYGITVCHENVVDHRCQSPEYMKAMRCILGDDFKIVLDIKQAALAKYTPYDFLNELSDSIVHIHISDRTEEKRCVTPLKGDFDFEAFFKALKDISYNGKCIIELYNWSYDSREDIVEAYEKLNQIIKNVYNQ